MFEHCEADIQSKKCHYVKRTIFLPSTYILRLVSVLRNWKIVNYSFNWSLFLVKCQNITSDCSKSGPTFSLCLCLLRQSLKAPPLQDLLPLQPVPLWGNNAFALSCDSQDLQRPPLAQLLLIQTVENHLVLVILAPTYKEKETLISSHEIYLRCHHQLKCSDLWLLEPGQAWSGSAPGHQGWCSTVGQCCLCQGKHRVCSLPLQHHWTSAGSSPPPAVQEDRELLHHLKSSCSSCHVLKQKHGPPMVL